MVDVLSFYPLDPFQVLIELLNIFIPIVELNPAVLQFCFCLEDNIWFELYKTYYPFIYTIPI
jgi:hypothetical protein